MRALETRPAQSDLRRRLPVILGLALAVLPLLQVILYLSRSLVDLPWWDEYDVSVFIAAKTAAGTLTLRDLLMQQNEHIIVFTNLITVISTQLFHWYVPLGSWISLVLAVINLALLLDLFRRDCPRVWPIAAPLFSVLVFSVRQMINWQSAFQSQWFFVILWFLAALWVLRVRPQGWLPVAAAAVLTLLATCSFTLGLLQWVFIPAVMFLLGYRRWRYYLAWAGVAALSLALYFALHVPNPPREFTFNPVSLTSYSLITLGAPFSWTDMTIATVFALLGLGILAANLVWLWRRLPRVHLVTWIALAVYAVAAAYVNAVGRAFLMEGDYVIQPLLGRYVSVSTLLWVAVVALALISLASLAQGGAAARWAAALRRANLTFMAIALAAVLINTLFFYEFPVAPPLVTPQQAECVRSFPQTNDDACLKGLHAKIEVARAGVLLLAKYHLSVFSHQP